MRLCLLIASTFISLVACTKATQKQSVLGLTSITFDARQDGRRDGYFLVNKTTKSVTFDLICKELMTELFLSIDDQQSFHSLGAINCVDERAQITLSLEELAEPLSSIDLSKDVIPFWLKANGPEFTSRPFAGFFLQPQFISPFFTIADAAQETNTLSVEIEFAAAVSVESGAATSAAPILLDPKRIYITSQSDCSTGGQWYDYASGRISNFQLPNENATNTLYAKFQDYAGNDSVCYSQSIIHRSPL